MSGGSFDYQFMQIEDYYVGKKEQCWLVVGILWVTIAFIRYCDEKAIKMKEFEINQLKGIIEELKHSELEEKNYNHIPRID